MLHLVRLFLMEEVRLRRSFSSALSLVIFPQLIFLGSLSAFVLYPLMGSAVSEHDLQLGAVTGLFMFGVSMGGLAFMGREFIERALGPVTMLSASTGYQPVGDRRMYIAYFLHDVVFYLLLVLLPMSGGLLMGALVRSVGIYRAIIVTASQWSSFFLGLSLSMAVSSAVNNRNRWALLLVPALLSPFIAVQRATGRMDGFLVPMMAINEGDPSWLVLTLVLILFFCACGVAVYDGMPGDSQRPSAGSYSKALRAARLVYPRDICMRSLLARDMMSLLRGKAYVRIAFSMLFPLIIISAMVGLIGRFEGASFRFNTTFFSVMVSFFSISVYSHMVNLDFLEFDQTVPVDVPMLIRVRLREHLAIAIPASSLFLLLMGAATGKWTELLFSVPLVLVAVPYMAYVTAYLTGLWTNTLLLDSSVFVRYMVFAVLPLMFSMMLSLMMTEAFLPSLIGISVMMVLGALASWTISKKLDERWRDAVLESALSEPG